MFQESHNLFFQVERNRYQLNADDEQAELEARMDRTQL
jgi:hypothetical protein